MPPSAQPPRVGDTLGAYRVEGRLGEGAMGDVLRVVDPQGRALALKLCRADVDASARERFAREGEVTAALRHSGIVAVHASGLLGERPYLVYELVEGEDLERAFGRLPQPELLRITQEVAEALGFAHAQGVIHRDLKPANVLLDAKGRARVADFGMAQAAGLERLTQTGALVGTPHYMAPEQVGGARELYGPHTDVWALGVLLYRVLTGRHPFQGRTLTELVIQVARAPVPRPRSLNPDVPPALEAVCLRALEREPQARTPDAATFAAELAAARVAPPPRRGRWLLPLAASALLGLSALGYLLSQDAPAPAPAPTPAPAPAREDPLQQALAAGDLTQARRALARATGPRAAAARAALVAAAQGALPDGERVDALLALLAEHEAPARAADPAEAALGAAGFARAWADYTAAASNLSETRDAERWTRFAARLEALAAAGLRVRAPGAPAASDALKSLERLGTLDSEAYWATVRTCAQLDLPCGLELYRITPGVGGTPDQRPWSRGTREPWARYVEARIACARAATDAHASLARELRGDLEPLLGPVHWAQAATAAAAGLEAGPARALLTDAVERAPWLPSPWATLGAARLAAGDPEAGLEALERARALLAGPDYAGTFAAQAPERSATQHTIEALAVLGRRDEARALFRDHAGRNPSFAAALAERHPWLAE